MNCDSHESELTCLPRKNDWRTVSPNSHLRLRVEAIRVSSTSFSYHRDDPPLALFLGSLLTYESSSVRKKARREYSKYNVSCLFYLT
nr:hypothetical protein Q903MT_gene6081 [Picea sitchensis]